MNDLAAAFGGGGRPRLDSGVSSVRSFSDFDGIDALPDTLHLPMGESPQPLFRSSKSVYATDQDSKRYHEASSSDGSVSSSSGSCFDSSDDDNPVGGGSYPSMAVEKEFQTPLSAASTPNERKLVLDAKYMKHYKHQRLPRPSPKRMTEFHSPKTLPAARTALHMPIHSHLQRLLHHHHHPRPQHHQQQRVSADDEASAESPISDGTVSDSDSDSSDE